MAPLLSEVLFETAGQGPPPSKDFYQIVITKNEVIWRWWKILVQTEFREAPPGEIKQFHHDFLNDARLQEQLASVFGTKILDYSLALCRGHVPTTWNVYLTCCSLKSFPTYPYRTLATSAKPQAGLGRLDKYTVLLSYLSEMKVCNSEEIWRQAVMKCDMITEDLEMLANVMGWKNIFFKFYYNKECDSAVFPAEEEDKANTQSL